MPLCTCAIRRRRFPSVDHCREQTFQLPGQFTTHTGYSLQSAGGYMGEFRVNIVGAARPRVPTRSHAK